jgi:dUTP pyrophosphatase
MYEETRRVSRVIVADPKLTVRCVRIHPDAKMPTRATEGSAGWDLYAAHDAQVEPGLPCAIDTGVAFEIPQGHFGAVCQRSGLARKGVICTYGVCDSDYRGAVGVTLLFNPRDESGGLRTEVFGVKAGDRVAQLLILPVPRVELVEVESIDMLTKTERAGNGFGSSGLR